MYDKVQSPELLLYNLSSVVNITVEHLLIPNTQALNSILELISVLSTDMRYVLGLCLTCSGELVKYYDKLLTALLSLMDQKEPERTSTVFQTLVLMFRNLSGSDIRNNISLIRKYYGPLFGNRAPFIRQFACESYCYLLRHMGSRPYRGGDTDESLANMAQTQLNEQVKELSVILKAVSRKPSLSDAMILGVSSLLFESIRGVGGQARQHGLGIFRALLEIASGKRPLDKSGGVSASVESVLVELQYALAEYITAGRSSGFVVALLEEMKKTARSHVTPLVEMLTVWIRCGEGSHCSGELFERCLKVVFFPVFYVDGDGSGDRCDNESDNGWKDGFGDRCDERSTEWSKEWSNKGSKDRYDHRDD